MAGLWCVNIGYGRTELADVAAEQMRQLSYFPHTAMNVPAAGAGREDQRADGRRLPHLLRQLGFRGERGRVQDRPAIHEARISRRISLQDRQPLFRLSRHHARHPGRRRHGRAQGEVRAVFRRFRACRAALLLSLPVRPELPELRTGLRQEHGEPRSSARGPRRWPKSSSNRS